MTDEHKNRWAPVGHTGGKFEIINIKTGEKRIVIVDEVISAGASCVAYKVRYEGAPAEFVLKEFCPEYLVAETGYKRDSMEITVPESHAERFQKDIEGIKKTYGLIEDLLSKDEQSSGFHAAQHGIFEGYGTIYTLSSYEASGINFADIPDEKMDLLTLLNTINSITIAIGLYHDAGILHLDIKPQNFFVLYAPDGKLSEIVRQFDYNSLTFVSEIEELKKQSGDRGKTLSLPRPGTYIVPELEGGNLNEIGYQTDIFEIGAMLYSRLVECDDSFYGFYYGDVIDLSKARLLQDKAPRVIYELESFIRKTLCVSVDDREHNTIADVRKHLEFIIELVKKSNNVRIANKRVPDVPRCFMSRAAEIKLLHEHLMTNGYAFVEGDGGIGKTTIAARYAEMYMSGSKKVYHTVQFCKYTKSLEDLILGLDIVGNIEDDIKAIKAEYPNISENEAVLRAKNEILHNSDSHTLIVVDNFNTTYDSFLREFLPINNDSFKVIFTTRCSYSDTTDDEIVNVEKFPDEVCIDLFCRMASATIRNDGYESVISPEDPIVRDIVKAIDRNTLILVLLAKAVKESGTPLNEILDKIENQKIDEIEVPVLYEHACMSDDEEKTRKIYAHLMAIFDVGSVSKRGKEILKALTLIPASGITVDQICVETSIKIYEINNLSKLGWIDNKNGIITMHPIVADLVASNPDIPKNDDYWKLASSLEMYCEPVEPARIDHVIKQIEFALCLDRRYSNEIPVRKVRIKLMLGKLYFNTYNRTKAEEYLKEAEEITTSEVNKDDFQVQALLPHIYIALGDLENRFGVDGEAIRQYKKAEDAAKDPVCGGIETVVIAGMRIGECHVENAMFDDAFTVYEGIRRYALISGFFSRKEGAEYNIKLAKRLLEICVEKGDTSQVETYENILNLADSGSTESDVPEIVNKVRHLSVRGEYFTDISTYIDFLETEEAKCSPDYKNWQQYLWMCYVLMGDYTLSISHCKDITDYIDQTYGSDSMEMAKHHVSIARLFPRMGEVHTAIDHAHKAISICVNNGEINDVILFRAYLEMAKCHFILGNITETENDISKIRFSNYDTTDILLEKLFAVGTALCELGEYMVVDDLCIALKKRLDKNDFNMAYVNIVYAISQMYRGYYSNAEKICNSVLPIIESMPDYPAKTEWYIMCRRVLAGICFKRGDYSGAYDTVNEMISRFRNERNELVLAQLYMECGVYLSAMHDYAEADVCFSKCEELLAKKNIPENGRYMLYNSIVFKCILMEDYTVARLNLDKIEEIRPGVTSTKTYSDCVACNNMGIVALHYQEDADAAKEFFLKACEGFERMGAELSDDSISTLMNLAEAYMNLGMQDDANMTYELAAKRRKMSEDIAPE